MTAKVPVSPDEVLQRLDRVEAVLDRARSRTVRLIGDMGALSVAGLFAVMVEGAFRHPFLVVGLMVSSVVANRAILSLLLWPQRHERKHLLALLDGGRLGGGSPHPAPLPCGPEPAAHADPYGPM